MVSQQTGIINFQYTVQLMKKNRLSYFGADSSSNIFISLHIQSEADSLAFQSGLKRIAFAYNLG